MKDQWRLIHKIGEGAYGEIYSAKNTETNEIAAIKLERADSKKQVLKLEVAVLKKLRGSNYVCKLKTWGRHSDWNFMVMELCGENLSELRKYQGGKFDLVTTLQIGIQIITIIEEIHTLGYIHRDIKPSNFVVGLTPDKRRNIYLIDFGLARKYTTNEGELRPEREVAGFRGTARYASLNSHNSRDLSRRDDMWSILFVLIEFATGSLPWRKLRDKDKIGEMKTEGLGPDLVEGLPPQFFQFLDHLQTLSFTDQPDYKFLKKLMQQALTNSGGNILRSYPWESTSAPQRLRTGTFESTGSGPLKPGDSSTNSEPGGKGSSTQGSSTLPSSMEMPNNNNSGPRYRLIKSPNSNHRTDSIAVTVPRPQHEYLFGTADPTTHIDLDISTTEKRRDSMAVFETKPSEPEEDHKVHEEHSVDDSSSKHKSGGSCGRCSCFRPCSCACTIL
uniref:non-specific serine/threonine protein kinase n=1 Tax=Arcella intermedia TaxID=1963864 RepID=A0A6B2L484_9EUKA